MEVNMLEGQEVVKDTCLKSRLEQGLEHNYDSGKIRWMKKKDHEVQKVEKPRD